MLSDSKSKKLKTELPSRLTISLNENMSQLLTVEDSDDLMLSLFYDSFKIYPDRMNQTN